ncbi:MAG: Gfo/Idh/MocA family oxidoreductase [Chloroflexi bacterium]|nr:Gfo/Idh/MocA family oxidoreductase [Chloroflexota bacterium]
MAKVYRLGVASMVHDHVWGELRHWKQQANVEIVAAADTNQPLLDKIKSEYGVQKLYHSWQEMIEKESLDIIQAASTNNAAADIVEAAAAKGIHVVSEKPMAAKLSQADRMLAAAEKHGTHLMINWPNAWSPQVQTFLRLIREGAIGQPVYLKYRAAHNGPKEIGCSEYFWKWLYDAEQNGAGALMDYCCYSADLNACLFGRPREVQGMRAVLAKDYPLPDDNAMIMMKYDKSFGVAEASWTQPVGYPVPNPICHGTNGCVYLSHGALWMQRTQDKEAQKVDPDALPDYLSSAASYLIHCIETGEAIQGMCSARVSRDAQ